MSNSGSSCQSNGSDRSNGDKDSDTSGGSRSSSNTGLVVVAVMVIV